MICDYTSMMDDSKTVEASPELYRKLVDKLKAFDVELFMHESPYNNYIPKPPEGFFAVRSHKRRLFVKGKFGLDIQTQLDKKEYIELPL